MNNKTLIFFFVLALFLTSLLFSTPVLASDGGDETLTVNGAWIDGDILRINVTDINGVNSALALRLSDYVNDAENKEFISIQAVDLAGNKSGIIEIKNPFYVPTAKAETTTTTPAPNESPKSSSSSVPNENKSFTPDGAGTVLDNATDGDGKEFFTIDTEDGSVFYLIVDRQKNSDNVYLLNAVTLDDLVALAKKSGTELTTNLIDSDISAIPDSEHPSETESTFPSTTETPDTTETPEKPSKSGFNYNIIIFIIIIVVVVGIGAYYFKIVKGKKNVPDTDNEDDDYEYEDEPEEADIYEDYGEYTSEDEDGGDER